MTELWLQEFQEQALTLTCNMWDSEDFPRYEYRLTPFAETDEFPVEPIPSRYVIFYKPAFRDTTKPVSNHIYIWKRPLRCICSNR